MSIHFCMIYHTPGGQKSARHLATNSRLHFEVSFFWKAGQWVPVERNTSMEGRLRQRMPKSVHERGNVGSQVTLKWTQLRQLGKPEGLCAAMCRSIIAKSVKYVSKSLHFYS
jgi:hypothetical protein